MAAPVWRMARLPAPPRSDCSLGGEAVAQGCLRAWPRDAYTSRADAVAPSASERQVVLGLTVRRLADEKTCAAHRVGAARAVLSRARREPLLACRRGRAQPTHSVASGWLSVRPQWSAPLACGWCVGCVAGFWVEQPYADRPSVFMDALDDVSVQLQLGDDGGWEVNPGGVELDKSDRLFTGLVQSL